MSGMGFPGPGCGAPNLNSMSQASGFVGHMMKPMGMDLAPPPLNPCAAGTCCGNACSFDCLCHLIDSDAKGIEVDDIYQVIGRDVLKSSVLDDIDLYLECDDDNVYNKAMPPKPGMETTKPKNSQEPFKFKFSFPTNTAPPPPDSKKSFVCEFCSQSFIKDHLLKNHQAKAHNVKDLFPCPQCAYRGQQHAHLQKHIKRMHKKTSQSDESSNNVLQNVTVLPPKAPDESVSQHSMPISNTSGTSQQSSTTTDVKPSENWLPLSTTDKTPAPIQETETVTQTTDNQGNVNTVQHAAKADVFSPQQIEMQKVPGVYNSQQSAPIRNYGTEVSPQPRSLPECSPRPGSQQSGHESNTSDFSILDISNNTLKAAESTTFLPGESLLAHLEGPNIYGSPKVDDIPFAVASPHNLQGNPPPNSLPTAEQQTPATHMVDYGSSGMSGVNMGQFHDRSPVMNCVPNSAVVQVRTRPTGPNPVNVNPTLTMTTSTNYQPRINPTPPDVAELKRRNVSPASGRTSASSIGTNSQGFPSPSPTNVPRIAPTPPDFPQPQMSPVAQSRSQHSSPTFGNVNQRFLAPSPPVPQSRVVPTPPEVVRHQMSPLAQPSIQQNPGLQVQSPPMGYSNSMPRPPAGTLRNPMAPQSLRHSPGGLPRGVPAQFHPNRPDMMQVNPNGFTRGMLDPRAPNADIGHPLIPQFSHQPPLPGLPRNASPQIDANQPQMPQVNSASLTSNMYQPSNQAHHVFSQQQQHNPFFHGGQFSPGQPLYPQNRIVIQGQNNMGTQPPRQSYGGPRYPQQISFSVQGQNINVQRLVPDSGSYPSPTAPHNPGINQNFVRSVVPDGSFPQQVQNQMYRPGHQQPPRGFPNQMQRHPYRVPYTGGGQAQGNFTKTFTHNPAPHDALLGVQGQHLPEKRSNMIIVQSSSQPTVINSAPARNRTYMGQVQGFQQMPSSVMDFQSPVVNSQEGNNCSGQVITTSGMMCPLVSQGNTASAVVHSNIGQQLISGPLSQGNIHAPGLQHGNSVGSCTNKPLLGQKELSESNVFEKSIQFKGVTQGHNSPDLNPVSATSLRKVDEISKGEPIQSAVEKDTLSGQADKVDINENQNVGSNRKNSVSGIVDNGEHDANENSLSVERQSADDKVNDKISWLLLHCGVNKTSDDKSGNSEMCRLEINTSEEEIGPVVHIMETQEVEGEMENMLDDISRSESDATQSDSVLPGLSPQINEEVFSPQSNSPDNSPPRLSRIDISSSGSKELKCEKCDYTCASKQLLKSHEKYKHDPNRKIYKCDTCQVELKLKASYESHMAKHNGEMKYECHVCHKLFANRLSFNLHIKTHNTERPFVCNVDTCSKVFRTKSDLNEHTKVVHGEQIHKCSHPGCNKRYSLEKDLRAHQVSHTLALKCSWPRCRKTFRDRFNLNNHYKTHTKEKPIECPQCDFRCIQKSSLDSHIKNHHQGSA